MAKNGTPDSLPDRISRGYVALINNFWCSLILVVPAPSCGRNSHLMRPCRSLCEILKRISPYTFGPLF